MKRIYGVRQHEVLAAIREFERKQEMWTYRSVATATGLRYAHVIDVVVRLRAKGLLVDGVRLALVKGLVTAPAPSTDAAVAA